MPATRKAAFVWAASFHPGVSMTWFTLPPLEAGQNAAFLDSRSASTWLAGQPQANAPAMLAEFIAQIQAFNRCRVAPDERFRTLTVLRNALFAVSGDCQRRYENKPLPLLRAEKDFRIRSARSGAPARFPICIACAPVSRVIRRSRRMAPR
jgi:hypothetical protein